MKLTPGQCVLVACVVIVVAVAAFAGVVSYSHFYVLGRTHGQDGTAARLTPLSVDLLILAASLVVLWAAMHQVPLPWAIRGVLIAGVLATIGGNVLYGLADGAVGAALSSWPGAAFVAAVEMLMWLVRAYRRLTVPAAPVVPDFGEVPADAQSAAVISIRATHAAGNVLSQNQVMARFGLTRGQEKAARRLALPDLAPMPSLNGAAADAT